MGWDTALGRFVYSSVPVGGESFGNSETSGGRTSSDVGIVFCGACPSKSSASNVWAVVPLDFFSAGWPARFVVALMLALRVVRVCRIVVAVFCRTADWIRIRQLGRTGSGGAAAPWSAI